VETPGMFRSRLQAAWAFTVLVALVAANLIIASALIWAIYTIVGRIPR
jgi:hypothetical protein